MVKEWQTTGDTIVTNLQVQMHHRLASQPFQNPKKNMSAITFRSGKELKEPRKSSKEKQEIEVNEPKPSKD